MAEDWAAVAGAIGDRMAELRETQMDVAARAKISLTTLRELQHNINPRRRRPQTLAAVSEALGWPSGYLAAVLRGEKARHRSSKEHDLALQELSADDMRPDPGRVMTPPEVAALLRLLVNLSGRLVRVIEGIASIEDRLTVRLNDLEQRIDAPAVKIGASQE